MNELREGMKLLLITHKEPVFDIMDGNEKKQILCTDGRATKQTTARGEIDVKAKWKDSTLEVTSISPGKPTILKKYSLTPDGKQLNVTVQLTVERLDKKVEIRYVYDLIP